MPGFRNKLLVAGGIILLVACAQEPIEIERKVDCSDEANANAGVCTGGSSQNQGGYANQNGGGYQTGNAGGQYPTGQVSNTAGTGNTGGAAGGGNGPAAGGTAGMGAGGGGVTHLCQALNTYNLPAGVKSSVPEVCGASGFTQAVQAAMQAPWDGTGKVADVPVKTLRQTTDGSIDVANLVAGKVNVGIAGFVDYYRRVLPTPITYNSGGADITLTAQIAKGGGMGSDTHQDFVISDKVTGNTAVVFLGMNIDEASNYEKYWYQTKVNGQDHLIAIDYQTRPTDKSLAHVGIWFVMPDATGAGTVYVKYRLVSMESAGLPTNVVISGIENSSKYMTHTMVTGGGG